MIPTSRRQLVREVTNLLKTKRLKVYLTSGLILSVDVAWVASEGADILRVYPRFERGYKRNTIILERLVQYLLKYSEVSEIPDFLQSWISKQPAVVAWNERIKACCKASDVIAKKEREEPGGFFEQVLEEAEVRKDGENHD